VDELRTESDGDHHVVDLVLHLTKGADDRGRV
jgi:hypothetical protein